MKKSILRGSMLAVLALTAMHTRVSAQATPGLDGTWFAVVVPTDCQNFDPIPGAPTFRGLYLFGHDGSLSNEAAFLMANPRRSSGLGTWRHTQAQSYAGSFQFFRYNPDGSFLSLRKVTTAIVLSGDQFTTKDMFQDFDANNVPTQSTGCNIVVATRQ
jgi:hypothetical protein